MTATPVANYLYDLVKLFNSFYQNVSVFGETQESLQSMRLLLCESVGKNIAAACAEFEGKQFSVFKNDLNIWRKNCKF